mmetsp:Transcript_18474/g.39687  ORF Transcript_18474/g.39687 Transcript_18474/m.39687 type:complete len:309 (+) Transcript_18474:31-957(+)|eukprot:CAMPEP_0172536494 /NCGR_PEP_ID=MMETSP1067-20121228/8250_1 /TAXON_ID=265564 ORGANISM="Thalassiosira punctigera, Strain Tpunct2005C2" /NCGR_SAMPLE_ID=MMETSP1067 /ASSEMBLY_ACC=CAM_ASM_000444 /LENGTH=308 /DNA_ID=CAMNT_0013321579 /DNA_START=27 /DNA_END=953 /DNA_ORIENTATION=-
MTIESAQVVYVVAPSGTGKSFTGDYLHVVHGFKHVDGDGPLKNCAVPKYGEMVKKLFTADKQPNPKEFWSPYFEEIARRTVDASKNHDKVVLTHATYQQEFREFVIEKIVEGGVSLEQITVVELTMDQVVKLRGLYHRTKRQVELHGSTIEEFCQGYIEYEGDELTEEKYINAMVEKHREDGGDRFGDFEDCPTAKKVDVSGRDISHCDNLDKALGLTRSGEDWTYETICAEVLPLDEERDEEFAASGSMKAMEEILSALDPTLAINEDEDEEEVKQMKKKRRSTIVQTKSWREHSLRKIDFETGDPF